MVLMAEWFRRFVLSPAGADHGLQHCSNQINIVLLCAVWEGYSCDLDIFVAFAEKSLTPQSSLIQYLSESNLVIEGMLNLF